MFDVLIEKFNVNKKTIFIALDTASVFIYLFIMAYSFSRPLRVWVNLLTGNSIIVITIYFSLFYALYFIFALPLKYYQGLSYVREHGFYDWLRTVFKKEVIVFFIMFFVIQFIYFFLETEVLWWWLPVSFLCIVSRYAWEFAPKYLASFLFRLKALAPSEFKQRLIELAVRGNIEVTDVFSFANAKFEVAFLGQGPGRKLILNEKIMDYAPEEIEILVAREAAEHYYRHMRYKLILEALVILLSFFMVNLAFKPTADYFGFEFTFNIETLPVLIGLFFIAFMLMSLIRNHYSRFMDKQVDIYALKATQAPAAFISLLFRQKEAENKYEQDYFLNQILNGRISETERITFAQDYAQGMLLKEKGK
ncbi:MAG: M48 family metalloprotease [Candidatus Omnitrophica bacterium]|nr:M48 family metalloprotease [Candidatus Omnitrophota bacterium]